jgi:hypothetical protein
LTGHKRDFCPFSEDGQCRNCQAVVVFQPLKTAALGLCQIGSLSRQASKIVATRRTFDACPNAQVGPRQNRGKCGTFPRPLSTSINVIDSEVILGLVYRAIRIFQPYFDLAVADLIPAKEDRIPNRTTWTARIDYTCVPAVVEHSSCSSRLDNLNLRWTGRTWMDRRWDVELRDHTFPDTHSSDNRRKRTINRYHRFRNMKNATHLTARHPTIIADAG